MSHCFEFNRVVVHCFERTCIAFFAALEGISTQKWKNFIFELRERVKLTYWVLTLEDLNISTFLAKLTWTNHNPAFLVPVSVALPGLRFQTISCCGCVAAVQFRHTLEKTGNPDFIVHSLENGRNNNVARKLIHLMQLQNLWKWTFIVPELNTWLIIRKLAIFCVNKRKN